MPSGIDLILADHQRVDALFAHYAETGGGATVGQIVDALIAHDDAEHSVLYPFSESLLGDHGLLERCDLAHRRVKTLIDHVRCQEGAALVSAVGELQAAVTAHVRDEEKNLLPALKRKASAAQLESLAARIEQNKQRVG